MQGSHLLYPTRGFVVNENPKSCVPRLSSPRNSEPSGQSFFIGAHIRVVCDTLACQVRAGHLPRRQIPRAPR
jgi:hypothetical protein